jgi:hypothetical protein
MVRVGGTVGGTEAVAERGTSSQCVPTAIPMPHQLADA